MQFPLVTPIACLQAPRHCVGPGESESASNTSCDRNVHEYNIPIRIGTLFVMLTTSMIGVFAPILLGRFLKGRVNSIGFTVVKQFGTGVIVATALIHVRIFVVTELMSHI